MHNALGVQGPRGDLSLKGSSTLQYTGMSERNSLRWDFYILIFYVTYLYMRL